MNTRKIMVVDDDPDQQLALQVRLTASGYQVVGAENAAQSILRGVFEVPDLVILDIGLPGEDGFAVLKRLRSMSSTAHVPVIALSAREASVYRAKMLAAGALAYFQKPADTQLLLAAIAQALTPAPPVSATPISATPLPAAPAPAAQVPVEELANTG